METATDLGKKTVTNSQEKSFLELYQRTKMIDMKSFAHFCLY